MQTRPIWKVPVTHTYSQARTHIQARTIPDTPAQPFDPDLLVF